jgi:DNA mismatch repair protein MutL
MDEIRLLSDAIANQIAAGEVVQRPSSVVKELLENAIDAGSNHIQLIIKEAGRNLIQVIDNGKGMSTIDARMCFERHATSKIKAAEDLFNIRTMGFRGEALASIAAVAQVELKTKREADELATVIRIEGSSLKDQEFEQGPAGSSLAIKNLFFNVPARRNFLKSNPVEMRHILDEFQRVALSYPDKKFSLHHNDTEVYRLGAAQLSKRIVDVLDKSYQDQMAKVEIDTPYVKINGFIGKPQMAKKSKGDQFFYVNNRYIKSSYLHHAILRVYDGTIAEGANPFYVLFLEIDPKHIDINIHPTKTEIKFDDEKTIYAILKSAAAKALGLYQMSPSLDFDSDMSLDRMQTGGILPSFKPTEVSQHAFNNFSGGNKSTSFSSAANTSNWQKLFDGLPTPEISQQTFLFESKINTAPGLHTATFSDLEDQQIVQIHQTYLLSQVKNGLMMIHQARAVERIQYETVLKQLQAPSSASQQVLFPCTVELSSIEYQVFLELKDFLNSIGFMVEDLGHNSVVINGVPGQLAQEEESQSLKKILELYQIHDSLDLKSTKERFAKAVGKRMSANMQKKLSPEEIKSLSKQLFETAMPNLSPDGLPIIRILGLSDLEALLV